MNSGKSDKQLTERIASFIESRIGIKVDQDTVLFTDLDLVGIDADQFLIEFSEEFLVNFDTLVFSDYFYEVSTIPFYHFFRKKYLSKKHKKREFNLQHLVNVVEKGSWYQPSL